jgi:hypothetical protein
MLSNNNNTYYNVVIVDDLDCAKVVGKYVNGPRCLQDIATYACTMIYKNSKLYGINEISNRLIFLLCKFNNSNEVNGLYFFECILNPETNKIIIKPYTSNSDNNISQSLHIFNKLYHFAHYEQNDH